MLQILKDSQCEVKTVITERANHAKELVHQLDPSTIDMILSVGGDGLFYEIIQGIMTREDKNVILGSVTVVPIPGGTGNGLAKSILYESHEDYSATNMCFLALKGQPRAIDLSLVCISQLTIITPFKSSFLLFTLLICCFLNFCFLHLLLLFFKNNSRFKQLIRVNIRFSVLAGG